jgi:hypothetical protein
MMHYGFGYNRTNATDNIREVVDLYAILRT